MTQAVEYLKSNSRGQVVEALKKVLANTYTLYFKTHSYHWNVEGPQFKSFHDLFMIQYTEMWQIIDELAERLRALDVYAPCNYEEISHGSTIKPAKGAPNAIEMAKELAADNALLAKLVVESLAITQEAGDEVTTDIFIGRATIHEKNAWMLRSMTK